MVSKLLYYLLLIAVNMAALLPPVSAGGTDATGLPAGKGQGLERALFAGGCFWKIQSVFSKVQGVVRTRAGYCGGTVVKPSYEQVCSDKTGHAETVQIEFDPGKVSYRKLLAIFFASHDPTTPMRQGPDIGSQYRSVIFFTTKEQKEEALQCIKELQAAHRFAAPVVTAVEPAALFYDAEEYHQDYFARHGGRCF